MVESIEVPLDWEPAEDPMGLWKKATTVKPSTATTATSNYGDLNDVIDTVISEAGGEGAEGMVAVANVIKNRAARRRKTFSEIVREPHQFEGYEAPTAATLRMRQDPALRAQAATIVQGVLTGEVPDITGGADHFHAGYVSPGWAKTMPKTRQIGGHTFYSSVGAKQAYETPEFSATLATDGETAAVTAEGPRAKLRFAHKGQEGIRPELQSILIDTGTELGIDLDITSGYRDPSHPVEARKKTPGEHSHGNAVDISMVGMNDAQRQALVIGLQKRGAKRFITYSDSPDMLHVDLKDQAGNGLPYFMHDKSARNMDRAPDWFKQVARSEYLPTATTAGSRAAPKGSLGTVEVPDDWVPDEDPMGLWPKPKPKPEQPAVTAPVEPPPAETVEPPAAEQPAPVEPVEAGILDDLWNSFSAGMSEDNPRAAGETLQAFGDAYDIETLSDLGTQITDWSEQGEKAPRPKITGYEQIRTDTYGNMLSDAAHYAAATLGSAAASTIPSLIGGWVGGTAGAGAGAAVTGPAAPGGAVVGGTIGTILGAAGPSYLLNAGDIYPSIREDPAIQAKIKSGELTKKQVARIALATAVPVSALDVGGAGRLLGVGTKKLKGAIAKRVAKRIADGSIVEGATEALQQAIQEGVQDYAGGSKELAEQINAVINAGIGGVLFGGVAGGAKEAVTAPAEEGTAEGEQPPAAEQPPPGAPPGAVPPVITSTPQRGPLESAVRHAEQKAAEKLGATFVINDPGAPTHGVRVKVVPDQAGMPDTMRKVILPDGQVTAIGIRLLEPDVAEAISETKRPPEGPPTGTVVRVKDDDAGYDFEAPIDTYSDTGDAVVGPDPATGEFVEVPLDKLLPVAQPGGRPPPPPTPPPEGGGGAPVAAPKGGGTPERIDRASVEAEFGDDSGAIDLKQAGTAVRDRISAALDEGRSVTLFVEGKPRKIVEVRPLGLVDEQNQPWGLASVLMPSPGEDARIEIEQLPPPAPPRAAEVKTELPSREAQKPALERFPGLPQPGQSVIVDAPEIGQRLAGKVISYEEGETEALIKFANGSYQQVPLDSLFVDKRTRKEVEAERVAKEPPVAREKAKGPTIRQVMAPTGKTAAIEMPDEVHARMYDLGLQRQQAKKLGGVSELDLDKVNPAEQEALARELNISPQEVGILASDYRYRVERAAATARSGLPQKMQKLNETRLKQAQRQWAHEQETRARLIPSAGAVLPAEAAAAPPARAEEAAAAPMPAGSVGEWWNGMTEAGRKRVLQRAKIKRSPKTLWERLPVNLQSKIVDARAQLEREGTAEVVVAAAPVDIAANQAATSPKNDKPQPTPAQIDAGNYPKGHYHIGGLNISIENPEGSVRKSKPGKPRWSRRVAKGHYGQILGTKGADGELIDIFVKPGTVREEVNDDSPAFIIDQKDPKTDVFDEHKMMLGYASEQEAREAYLANYPKNWKGLGAISATTVRGMKEFVGPEAPGFTDLPFSLDEDGNPPKGMKLPPEEALPATKPPPREPYMPDFAYGETAVFPAPAKTIDPAPVGTPTISQEEADARVARWKEVAKRVGRENDNFNKVIVSLFDESGAWSQPFVDAGYRVYKLDINLGEDIFYESPEALLQEIEEKTGSRNVVGVLSACPCTTFAGSGARWWKERHDVSDNDMVKKLFGAEAAKSFDTPVEANAWMVHMTAYWVDISKPTDFYVLENPIGRIGEMSGLPKPTMRFDPADFGDPYTKRTQLWGEFKTDMPIAPVEPTEGSKIQAKLRGDRPEDKKARSRTPDGFAYAFFMANEPSARAYLAEPEKPLPPLEPALTDAQMDALIDEHLPKPWHAEFAPGRQRVAFRRGEEGQLVHAVPNTRDAVIAAMKTIAAEEAPPVAQAPAPPEPTKAPAAPKPKPAGGWRKAAEEVRGRAVAELEALADAAAQAGRKEKPWREPMRDAMGKNGYGRSEGSGSGKEFAKGWVEGLNGDKPPPSASSARLSGESAGRKWIKANPERTDTVKWTLDVPSGRGRVTTFNVGNDAETIREFAARIGKLDLTHFRTGEAADVRPARTPAATAPAAPAAAQAGPPVGPAVGRAGQGGERPVGPEGGITPQALEAERGVRIIPRDTSPDTPAPGQSYTDFGIDSLKLTGPKGEAARAEVVRRGEASGKENLVVLDVNGDVVANGEGAKSASGMTERIWAILTDPAEQVVIHHNHPPGALGEPGVSLSPADVSVAALPGVVAVYAHTHEGVSYRVSALPLMDAMVRKIDWPQGRRWPKTGSIQNAIDAGFKHVIAALSKQLVANAKAKKLTAVHPAEKERFENEIAHLRMMALHDAGWVDYDSGERKGSFLLDQYRDIKNAYEGAVNVYAARAGIPPRDARRADRHPVAVGHPGELESVSRRHGGAAAQPAAQPGAEAGAGEPAAEPGARPEVLKQPGRELKEDDFDRMVREARERIAAREAKLAELVAGGPRSIRFVDPRDTTRRALVSPDLERPGSFRVTRFDAQGPFGHGEYTSFEKAVEAALQERYEPVAPGEPLRQEREELPFAVPQPGPVARTPGRALFLDPAGRPLVVKPTGGKKGTIIKAVDVATAFDKQHKKRFKGRKFFAESDRRAYNRVLEMAREDMHLQLPRENSGVGWYDKDVELALNMTSRVFPTLATEPSHVELYLTFAGIFSTGTNPEHAWMMSAEAFRYFIGTGEIPIKRRKPDGTPVEMTTFVSEKTGKTVTQPKGWGPRSAGNEQQLSFVKYLVEREGSLKGAMDWLLGEQPRAEINRAMTESGLWKTGRFITRAELAGGPERGTLAFGEKLGRYMLGLHGLAEDQGDTTVDLWFTRTYRRWTGRLFDPPIGDQGFVAQPSGQLERDAYFRLTGDLAREFNLPIGDVQAVLWFFEKRLWGAHGLSTQEGTNSSGARRLLRAEGVHIGEGGGGPGVRPVPQAALRTRRGREGQSQEEALRQQRETLEAASETPPFKRWFKQSRVVDTGGEPLPVYHHGSFDEREDIPREGMHFGTEQAARERAFAKRAEESLALVTVYETDTHVWHWDDGQGMTSEEIEPDGYISETAAERAGLAFVDNDIYDADVEDLGNITVAYLSLQNPKRTPDVGHGKEGPARWAEEIAKAKAEGYDGIVYRNQVEDRGSLAWIAFKPTQIKSVNNIGTFGEAEVDILRLRRDTLQTPEPPRRGRLVDMFRNKLTDWMPHVLATIPLNYFPELAQPTMRAVKNYLLRKREMDAFRGKLHEWADKVAQEWRRYTRLGKRRGQQLADLMHDSTIAGLDPTSLDDAEQPGWQELRTRYMAMPQAGRDLYVKVRDTYRRLADETDRILLANLAEAQAIAQRRADRRYLKAAERIRRSTVLTPQEKAVELTTLRNRHTRETTRARYEGRARITRLRRSFETNRLKAPYFPLARFGDYYVDVRNDQGDVVSFSRRERKGEADALMRRLKVEYPPRDGYHVTVGRLNKRESFKERLPASFIGEVEGILQNANVDAGVMDAIWQRYLQSMPDLSLRKSRLHRKGTPGFDRDALRVFAHQTFHGGHQMARLKFGQVLGEQVEQAREQAMEPNTPDQLAGTTLANELSLRHDWVMNPTSNALANKLSRAAFIWYLGATPAAAMVNLSQTFMLGIPILGARFGGITKATAAIMRALPAIFGNRRLSAEDQRAMQAFYDSGMIDRTQSHDIAGIGETGEQYSPVWTKVMTVVSSLFHYAELANRRVTALAAYRLARAAGQSEPDAIDTAHELTWKTHFDYANSSRPRFLQNDFVKVAATFKAYQINMLYRLIRDFRQAFKGATPQAKKEARAQLAGILGMQAILAGTTGFVGFNLAMFMMSMIDPPDEDDPLDYETKLKNSVIDTFGPHLGGVILNGVPGSYLGIDLANRIGMPDLMFQTSDQDKEGDEEFLYYVLQAGGVAMDMAYKMSRAFNHWQESGDIRRAFEEAAPKFVKDGLKTYRYMTEGVNTFRGDPIVAPEDVDFMDYIKQALGFRPLTIAEAQERQRKQLGVETVIERRRQMLINRFAMAEMAGDDEATDEALEEIERFNESKFGQLVPIKPKTLIRSIKKRESNLEKSEGGVLIESEALGEAIREAIPSF